MEGLLASLALATLFLGFIIPRRVLPRSVDSLGGLAAILARSSTLLRPLPRYWEAEHDKTTADPRVLRVSNFNGGG
jgi:hypothetical protein